MSGARSSGPRKRKRSPNRSTPGPQPSSCIPTDHEQELQSQAVASTIFVNPFPKPQRADEPSVLAESSPNTPSSEGVHLSPSAIHSPKPLQQDSQSRTAGMEPSKQHSSPVAHNRLAESPSQGRRMVTIKVPRKNNGNAGSKEPIASQQKQASSRTKELDTLLQVPMKESTTDKLTGITTYGTTPGTEHAISSLPTSSQLEQNMGVIKKTKLATIQMKGKPICSFCHKECSDTDSFREHVRVWCQYRPDLKATESYVPLPSFREPTADRTHHHSHYLSDGQSPPYGIIGNAEQSLNIQGYLKHHDTSVPDGVNEEDNDPLVYEAETQCALVKLTFFQSCQPCRIEKKDCNGESPCDKCTSFGEDCKYEIESESKGRGVEKRRFFEACNRCEDIKAKHDGQKPCDGQYPCGSCIDSKTQCIYSIKPEMHTDLATENIALLSRRVKEMELTAQGGLIAAILRPYSRVRRSIAKCYGGISKALRYKKPESRMD